MQSMRNFRKDTENVGNDSKGPLGLSLLHSPPEPLIDFIFVHGLGGGSRKTWSKTSSISHYWPQEWLPKDPAFKNVRVHSFGYDSDYLKGKGNCLNVHHFGRSLLGEMHTSPSLDDADTPMVLIGHSMGGVIIKKAYMLARQDKVYEALTKRFHSIFFLATPHRGSEWAKVLNGILQVAYSSRAYVADLDRRSKVIQLINDEFHEYSDDISLWSFYETQKLQLGVFGSLIVEPDSATLGYRDERQMPMNANHRSICKFETQADQNYVILRNALASTVNCISQLVLESKERLYNREINDLQKYLDVSEKPEDDLCVVEDARMPGTCEWFSARNSYMTWRDCVRDAPSVFWVHGKPAAGKSVLAGYAIGQLKTVGANCSWFFFKHGDKSKSRLSTCLRSLALQMARTNTQARQTLLNLQKDGVKFDDDSERTIWQKLFLSGIFQTKLPSQHWVIDALDECADFAFFFDSMLAKLDQRIPLRILITSRHTADLEQYFFDIGAHRFQSESITIADTLPDIKLLVESKAKSLAVRNEDRACLVGKILERSKGSFMWTVLVLNELLNSYGEGEMNQILDEVPRGMEALYRRTLECMSEATRGKKLAKAILTWATCAARPLTTMELSGALKLDLKDSFPKLRESIVALCGQLIAVDKFGRVKVVHETVREFLLDDNLESEFAVNKLEAHTRIAKVCFTYLTGQEMNPPRTGRCSPAMIRRGKRTPFSLYACAELSYHLAKADPGADDVLILVEKFLKSNVLSWIESVVQTKTLVPLIGAANALRTYLNSCVAVRPPHSKEMQTIRGWSTDLIRIASKFADALIISPSAIYSLILPFCPTNSTVYKTLALGRRRLSVVGLSNTQWDDRLSCINFHNGRTSAVCYGDEFFAVGLTTGTVTLYCAASCQEYKTLNHGEAVKFLRFRGMTGQMASCGTKTIRVWDIRTGETTHSFQALRCMELKFEKNLLIAASYKNHIASWDLDNNGVELPNRPWSDSGELMKTPLRRQPCAISISVSHKMLAVAYIGKPITLWDLEEDDFYGTCGKKLPDGETSTEGVTTLVFNPNPDIDLLAVSYFDGMLVLLDPFNDQEFESFRAQCQTLAASPDGRLLAGGAGAGTINIYEFETLRLLYQVKSSNSYINQLAFSGDSTNFADIRGPQCNVWRPVIPLRDLESDDSSESTSATLVEATSSSTTKISAMVLHPGGEFVFCGKDDGSVSLHDLKAGALIRTLYCHKPPVRILTYWSKDDIILSVDIWNGIYGKKLKKSQKGEWAVEKTLFQSRLDSVNSITQALLGGEAGKFILSTRTSDHFWEGCQESMRTYSDRPGIRKWIQHPQSPLHMICVEDTAARIYSWSDWSEVASVPLAIAIAGLQLKTATPYMSGHRRRIFFELSELDGPANTRGLHLLEVATLSVEDKSTKEVVSEVAEARDDDDLVSAIENAEGADPTLLSSPQLTALAHHVVHIIGPVGNGRFIFLNNQSWVCSIDLENLGTNSISYLRHFFVPHDWFAGTREVICAVAKRDVLFARNDEVAIVKGGLGYAENVNVRMEGD